MQTQACERSSGSAASAHLLQEVADRVVVRIRQEVRQPVLVARPQLGVVHEPSAEALDLLAG